MQSFVRSAMLVSAFIVQAGSGWAAALDLQVWNPVQTPQEYKVAARITNRGPQAVALNRLQVRVWFHYQGPSGLVPASYGNNQTIYNAAGQWVANVDATSVQIQALPQALNCGAGRRASHVAVISFSDAAAKTIPAGGYVESNSPTNPLAAWHRSDWQAFDRGLDYSRVTEAGSSSAGRADLHRFALHLDGSLACEAKAAGPDPQSGRAPCGPSACATPTPTVTPTRTPTPSPTATRTETPLPAATPTLTGPVLKLKPPKREVKNREKIVEFYAGKRALPGETHVPVELYQVALAHAENMPRYDLGEGSFASAGASAASLSAVGPPGCDWEPLGPGNIGGRTREILIDPVDPTVLYAAGVAGGVFKSSDAGAGWNPTSDFLQSVAVASLAMDPADRTRILAGTGEGFGNIDAVRGLGIYQTTDAGATWAVLPSTQNANFYYVNSLVISPVNSQRIYAATRNGIMRSLDGGASWALVLNTAAVAGCTDLVIRSDQATDFVIAACGTFNQATLYRNPAAEGAGAWTGVFSPVNMGRSSLALAPSNQAVVYALASNFNDDGLLGLYRSVNGGLTWTSRWLNTGAVILNNQLLSNPFMALCYASPGFNQGWYDNVVAVDPLNADIVWAGGVEIFRSDDGGANWGQAGHWVAQDYDPSNPRYIHADHHSIVFHPAYDGVGNQTMYVGNDGGVFRTDNARAATTTDTCNPNSGAVTWTPLNIGYQTIQFYYGQPYPDGATYVGGAQDNGTSRGVDGGVNAWTKLVGGDGGAVAVDPTNTLVLYAENTELSIIKSVDGGANWNNAIAGIGEASANFLFIAPFKMDPGADTGDNLRLWTGGRWLWRTNNGAASWGQVSQLLASRVSAIGVSPLNSDRVVVGTQTGVLYRSAAATSAGAATVWPATAPRGGYVSSVNYSPTDLNTVYATYSTFGGAHVWRSLDNGATWAAIDGAGVTGLPDVPAHDLFVDPAVAGRLVVGTDIGLFVTVDGGLNWALESGQASGFPRTVVEDLGTDGAGRLFAFTHGRGAWRICLNSPPIAACLTQDWTSYPDPTDFAAAVPPGWSLGPNSQPARITLNTGWGAPGVSSYVQYDPIQLRVDQAVARPAVIEARIGVGQGGGYLHFMSSDFVPSTPEGREVTDGYGLQFTDGHAGGNVGLFRHLPAFPFSVNLGSAGAPDEDSNFRIELDADDIRVYRNNVLIITATDNTFASGRVLYESVDASGWLGAVQISSVDCSASFAPAAAGAAAARVGGKAGPQIVPRFSTGPNPSRGDITIFHASPLPLRVRYTLLDIQGQVVARLEDRTLAAGENRIAWTLPQVASGIYFVRAEETKEGHWVQHGLRKIALIR